MCGVSLGFLIFRLLVVIGEWYREVGNEVLGVYQFVIRLGILVFCVLRFVFSLRLGLRILVQFISCLEVQRGFIQEIQRVVFQMKYGIFFRLGIWQGVGSREQGVIYYVRCVCQFLGIQIYFMVSSFLERFIFLQYYYFLSLVVR